MCEAFNKTTVTKTLLGEVHKLLRLYLTLTVPSAISDFTFFALRQLENSDLRSTIKQDRLNKCLVPMHCHKSIMDTPWILLRLQRGLLVPTKYANYILGHSSSGMCVIWCTMRAPPPTPKFQNAPSPY